MSTQEERLEEFIQKLKRIESEISLLTEEKKHLFDDFKEHFDPRVAGEKYCYHVVIFGFDYQLSKFRVF